jgi:hypothetical protein
MTRVTFHLRVTAPLRRRVPYMGDIGGPGRPPHTGDPVKVATCLQVGVSCLRATRWRATLAEGVVASKVRRYRGDRVRTYLGVEGVVARDRGVEEAA